MGDTRIQYLTKRWNCAQGCDESKPCAPRCWAKREAWRMAHNGNEAIAEQYRGLVRKIDAPLASLPGESDHERLVWTGVVRINERHLLDPLHWRKPLRVGVAFGGDIVLLPHEQLDRIFAVMALCPQHQFFVLTKRAEKLIGYMVRLQTMADKWLAHLCEAEPSKKHSFTPSDVLNLTWMRSTFGHGPAFPYGPWPLPNVTIGTSISNQPDADGRLPYVMKLAAQGWRTWVSAEPLLEDVDLRRVRYDADYVGSVLHGFPAPGGGGRISWLVIGAESGPVARYCDPEWIRSLVDQARAWGVPCFVKQMHLGTADSFRLSHDANEWPEWARVQELPAKERA